MSETPSMTWQQPPTNESWIKRNKKLSIVIAAVILLSISGQRGRGDPRRHRRHCDNSATDTDDHMRPRRLRGDPRAHGAAR